MQDAMGVDSFASSDGAFAAEALFEAYKSGDVEEVRKCIQNNSTFMELDNQVRGIPFHKEALEAELIYDQHCCKITDDEANSSQNYF